MVEKKYRWYIPTSGWLFRLSQIGMRRMPGNGSNRTQSKGGLMNKIIDLIYQMIVPKSTRITRLIEKAHDRHPGKKLYPCNGYLLSDSITNVSGMLVLWYHVAGNETTLTELEIWTWKNPHQWESRRILELKLISWLKDLKEIAVRWSYGFWSKRSKTKPYHPKRIAVCHGPLFVFLERRQGIEPWPFYTTAAYLSDARYS